MPRLATPEEFSEWVRPHIPALARLAARLAPREDRDDIVQDALVRAWLKREQFDPSRGSPSAWLLAITADRARKARRRADVTLTDIASPNSPMVESIDLDRALRSLARRQRLAVDCFYFVGLSVAETAAVMRCAEGTVKSTLADARSRLRSILEVDDE